MGKGNVEGVVIFQKWDKRHAQERVIRAFIWQLPDRLKFVLKEYIKGIYSQGQDRFMGNTEMTGLKKDKIRNHKKIINTEDSKSSSSFAIV